MLRPHRGRGGALPFALISKGLPKPGSADKCAANMAWKTLAKDKIGEAWPVYTIAPPTYTAPFHNRRQKMRRKFIFTCLRAPGTGCT